MGCIDSLSIEGMANPRRISLLEESRNQGMAKYHSSGIEEGKIYKIPFKIFHALVKGAWLNEKVV